MRFLLQEGVECIDHGLSLASLFPDDGCPARADGTFNSSGFGDDTDTFYTQTKNHKRGAVLLWYVDIKASINLLHNIRFFSLKCICSVLN